MAGGAVLAGALTRGKAVTPLHSHPSQVKGYLFSGSTGQQLGHPGSLGVDTMSGAPLHITRAGAPYILFPCGESALGA